MSFKRHHDINETTVELDFDNPKSSIIVIECLYVLFHVCDKVHTNNNHIFTHFVLDMGSSHQTSGLYVSSVGPMGKDNTHVLWFKSFITSRIYFLLKYLMVFQSAELGFLSINGKLITNGPILLVFYDYQYQWRKCQLSRGTNSFFMCNSIY